MIYIIGGRGFIGSAFARVCAARGRQFLVIDRNNYADTAGTSCDLLINAAGNSRKYISNQEPLLDFDASVRSVRASLTDFRYAAYLLFSSADVYPDSSAPDSTQEDQNLAPAMMTAYGFHKYLAELCVQHAAGAWLIVRGGGFVGPGLKKNAIYDILRGGPLWCQPDSELQYMHTEDAALAALTLVDRQSYGQVFNLCAEGVVKISQVMEWAGRPVAVQPGSPLIRCELNLEKTRAAVALPKTEETVLRFVHAALHDPAMLSAAMG